MNLHQWLVGGACALLAGTSMAEASPVAVSGFVSDANGWSAENGALNFSWIARLGDPGGYVSARDDQNAGGALWFFSAPFYFLGDKSAVYGGTLGFSLESTSFSEPATTPHANVQLLGNNGVLLTYDGGILPSSTWSRFQVDLVADGSWTVGTVSGRAATEADFLGVLGDLKTLRINGDFYKGIETTSLDSVVLSAPPVPEPATALLWLAGVAGVLGVARRRRIGER